MNGHPLRNYVQVIFANDKETAMKKMFELYGKDWGFDYSEKQWIEAHNDVKLKKIELPYVYCEPVMTTGEMYAWTNRLNGIVQVGGPLKIKRLNALVSDLEQATNIDNDKFARSLYLRVREETNGYGKAI